MRKRRKPLPSLLQIRNIKRRRLHGEPQAVSGTGKKIQKMDRGGLVEQNRAAVGEEQRISQRTANTAFNHTRPAERGDIRQHAAQIPAKNENTPAPVRKQSPKNVKKKQSTKFVEHAARPDSEEKATMQDTDSKPIAKRHTTRGMRPALETEPPPL